MRARHLIAMVASVATSLGELPRVAASCSSCRYTAWNCSVEEALQNETEVHGASFRKEAAPEQALAVCDAAGKIQVDDVFCGTNDCACVDGKSCVNLLLGCQNIFLARSRKRCLGDATIQQRFQLCAISQALTTQPRVNLADDWVYFNQPDRCTSADCGVVRRFQQCGVVPCGRLVVAWKESDSDYRFVVDGTRAPDMDAGTFLFNATSGADMCMSVTNTRIKDCCALQTRNQKNGTCNGIYLKADTTLQLADDSPTLSSLSWGLYLAVVGSVAAALASVASVAVVVVRHRRERQLEERSGLLPDDSAELQTPELDASDLKTAPPPSSKELRQRPLSPRNQETS